MTTSSLLHEPLNQGARSMTTLTTIEYRTIDKSKWPHGEWSAEPDKKQWTDEATGLPCLAVRNPRMGFWCGYVGVDERHPAHGLGYYHWRPGDDAAPLTSIETAINDIVVHGGLTFSDGCSHGDDPSRGVCHIPAPGQPDDVWWFGFDCGHYRDLAPGMSSEFRFDGGGVYRSLSYVERQCADLARQLADMAPPTEETDNG